SRPMEAVVPYGYLNTHIRHRATAWATYRWDLSRFGSLSTSVLGNYRTGRVWEKTASVPEADLPEYLGDGQTYTHFFSQRGEFEFPSIWSVDFAARYALPLWRDIAPFVKLDVQNILDNDDLAFWNTNGRRAAVNDEDGNFSHWTWTPSGNCGLDDQPSRDCTGFGRIANEGYYQTPRTIEVSVGLQF
ncbi:MAG: hypothetical protein R3338_07150, partial [Thermoanaerobaculia bacterium]|nr:hypothetical protein [Thermoanaerobaculia bacterium]